MEAQSEIKVPNSKLLELDPPKEGETEKEAERRRLMNSFKTGMNADMQKKLEEAAAKERALAQAKEDKEILEAQSRTRIMGAKHIDKEDLTPDPFRVHTEDVVANTGSDEAFERRTDYDLEKGRKEE